MLIAVLLSAQCTDKRVNKVTPKLFSIAKNPVEMSKLSLDTVYEIIRPCGLAPKKSRAIVGLSKIIVDKYKGKVPKDLSLLEELPGVGHKTASVLISVSYTHLTLPTKRIV